MSRESHPPKAALAIDFGAVIQATDSYLKEHNLYKDYISLEHKEAQERLFEHIDQETDLQRMVYTELLREFWTLYFEATPYNEQIVLSIVNEHLETKRQTVRAIVELDLAEQEEHERIMREGLLVRLKVSADKMWRMVKVEWDSSTPLEVGLTTAATIACLWFVSFFWWATHPALPMMGFLFGAFAGFMMSGIRATQIENKRWREWRAQLAIKR